MKMSYIYLTNLLDNKTHGHILDQKHTQKKKKNRAPSFISMQLTKRRNFNCMSNKET